MKELLNEPLMNERMVLVELRKNDAAAASNQKEKEN